MDRFIINGPNKIEGAIAVQGAKNHALKLIPAALLCDGPSVIHRVPNIADIRNLIAILIEMGIEATFEDGTVTVDPSTLKTTDIPEKLASKFRASIMLVAPLLAKHGNVRFPHPGGCVIGKRPIDFFVRGYEAMGATVKCDETGYTITKKGKLQGCDFVFPRVSMMGTESLILQAALAKGETKITSAAQEPEVEALIETLNNAGAKIEGAASSVVTVKGVKSIKGFEATCIPDRIETGTYAILGALGGGKLEVTGIDPSHLKTFWYFLQEAGVNFSIKEDRVIIKGGNPLKSVGSFQTREHPGFPTDLQAPFTVLMTQVEGLTLVHETVFEGRMFYTDLLNRMGANIILCDPHRAVVSGKTPLIGKKLESPDIRAGIALVIAASIAEGESIIDNVHYIDRGYANIVERLSAIGMDITRESV